MPRFFAPSRLRKIPWRKNSLTFLTLTLSLSASLAIFLFIHAREATNYDLARFMHEQQSHMQLTETLVHLELARQSRDLLSLIGTPVVLSFFASPSDPVSQQMVNAGLINYIGKREDYDQARIFDTNGRELIRVEKREQQTAVIPLEELEPRSSDAFLKKVLQLELQGQIVFSPMELARDQKGDVPSPFHPLFHLGAPIFDRHNHKVGVLLLTCRGQQFLDLFTQATRHYYDHDEFLHNNHQILNQEGYWLLAPDNRDDGGFIRDPQRRFDLLFPEVWQAMRQQGQGQIRTADGLFTFSTLMPAAEMGNAGEIVSTDSAEPGTDTQHAAPFWILLNQVSPEGLDFINLNNRQRHILLFMVIITGFLPLLLWLTLLLNKEREHKEHLQTQEQRFRLLYDKAPLPYQSMDQEGRILNINQNWLAVMGYQRDEVIGRRFNDFILPQSLPHFEKNFSLFLEKGEIDSCELELVKKDGSMLLASFHAESAADSREISSQTHCIFTDITELRAEKQQTTHLSIILKSIIQIHRIIDQARGQQELVQACCDALVTSRGYDCAWIILLDTAGKIELSANSGLLPNFDQFQEQINRGKLPPCIPQRHAQQKVALISTPAIFCTQCPLANSYRRTGAMCAVLYHKSKTYGYLNVSIPINFIEGQEETERFSEIARDIGHALFNLEQQKKNEQAERALSQSEERLQSITDSAKDAILMMDGTGAISFWNPAAEKIFGYRADETLGQDLHTLLAPMRYHAAQKAAFSKFVTSGHGKAIGKTIELAARCKDGREIPVTLSLSSVFHNEKWHAVGILCDMTERKLMEGQMLRAEKMATIAKLAAGVAHEINTPLSAILQSIQVIRQSLSPELARNKEVADRYGLDLTKVEEYLEKRDIIFFMDGIRDSAIKSGRIIKALLQFSRPRKSHNSSENLALLLNNAVELAKNDYDLRKNHDITNIEIVRDYSPNLPLVSCMAADIEQVFINLLKNAVQSMADRQEPKPKGLIILRTLLHGEMARVEIEDNGSGMDEATKRHIFDPFFTTRDIGGGTGLGLSVAYTTIVTKHGGQLTVKSTPGQGATLFIDLPILKDGHNQELS